MKKENVLSILRVFLGFKFLMRNEEKIGILLEERGIFDFIGIFSYENYGKKVPLQSIISGKLPTYINIIT